MTTQGPKSAGRGLADKQYVLVLLVIASGLNHLDRNIISILIEPIKRDLQVSDTAMGLLTGLSFALLYSILSLPMGWLADNFNRRKLLAASLFVWSGMTIACSAASNYVSLFLARMGVGVGEAGGIPVTTSLIGDYFNPGERGAANGWIGAGSLLGAAAGLAVGGIINEAYGWRWAFVAAGLPGLLLAPIIWFTLKEPRRGLLDGLSSAPPSVPPMEALSRLLRNRPLMHLIAGGALANIGNAVILWLPPFYGREFGLGTADIGMALTVVQGVGAIVGVLGAGWLADRLFRRDPRWHIWMTALTTAASAPFLLVALFLPELWMSLGILVIAVILKFAYLGPYFAALINLSGPRLRGSASALSLLAVNVLGLGLGPVLVGVLSDYLSTYGGGLREALALITPILFWSALHFYLAARTSRQLKEAR